MLAISTRQRPDVAEILGGDNRRGGAEKSRRGSMRGDIVGQQGGWQKGIARSRRGYQEGIARRHISMCVFVQNNIK
jgi:hypothetical protein